MTGSVVLVATPIGNLGDLSPRAVETLAGADLICCEDTRRTRKLLSHAGIHGSQLVALHQHNEPAVIPRVLEVAGTGSCVAVVSDAGMPALSDPGERLVAAAIAAGVPVSVVPGPNAALSALVISGFPLDRFAVEGFLPARGAARQARLAGLAGEARTVALYEAPHRLRRTLGDLLVACGGDRALTVARELTKLHETVWRGTLEEAGTAFAQSEPRGEYVIVLAGRPEAPPADPETVERLVGEQWHARMTAGQDSKTAISEIARELGVPRRRVYELTLALKADRRAGGGPVP